MAPKAGKIQARVRVAEFDIEGDDWAIEFRPFSSNMLHDALKGDESEQYDALCKLLGDSILEWNLEDDDGKALPIAPDKHLPPATEGEQGEVVVSPGMAWLRSVGLDYVRLISDGLIEATKVPKASASASSAGLRRVV